MTDFHSGLREIVASLRFTSSTSLTFSGEEFEDLAAAEPCEPEYLVTRPCRLALAHELYETIHCRIRHATLSDYDDSGGATEFAAQLAAANNGTGQRVKLRAKQRSLEYLGIRFEISNKAVARLPREHRNLYPGFYVAISNAPEPERPVVRLYWHLAPAGAPTLVRDTTRLLNRARLPFRLKILSDPLRYSRTDAAVLYLPAEVYDRARPILRRVHEAVRDFLYPEVSLFAKELAPGLGLAEDASDTLSFGELRAQQLASALCAAAANGPSEETRLAAVLESFRGMGVEPERTFLNRGSADRYGWPTSR